MSILLIIIEIVGFLSFLYIALKLLITYRKLMVQDLLLPSTSFIFLSISQLCAALSIIYNDIRISTSFYTATASLAIVAFLVMIIQKQHSEEMYIFTPYIALLMIPDVVAGILSTYIAIQASGYTKILLLILSSSYYLRAVSVVVGVEITPLLLLIAELVRSISAVALAIYSSAKVFKL
jgi:hypothetical protein